MTQLVRYRTGIDGRTGKVLTGFAHVAQSLAEIWMTRRNVCVMLLEFGSDIRSFLSEDITAPMVLELYAELVTSAHRWEPEYRISQLQLVSLKRTGGLGLKHSGTYYPEGRFSNYALAENQNALVPISAREQIFRAVA